MSDNPVDTRFAFQPLVNLHTGGVVALEMLARPPHGDVQTLLWSAARAGRLEKLDVALAVAAAHHSSAHETLLPLHLNLLADTVMADEEALIPLHRALDRTGRPASETVLDINPPYIDLEPGLLLAGLRRLRRRGYRISLDGVGGGGYPLTVIAEARPDLIKMDREIVAGLPEEGKCIAVLEALAHLAPRIGAQLVAEGVEHPEQMATLRQYDVVLGVAEMNTEQTAALHPPRRRLRRRHQRRRRDAVRLRGTRQAVADRGPGVGAVAGVSNLCTGRGRRTPRRLPDAGYAAPPSQVHVRHKLGVRPPGLGPDRCGARADGHGRNPATGAGSATARRRPDPHAAAHRVSPRLLPAGCWSYQRVFRR
ncbi:MAG: EAL domain-containing protein [Pseudonocardiaceae bacterium]